VRRVFAKLVTAFFLLPFVVLAFAGPASAHEHRHVAGKYTFTVGWGDEPTYTGFKNSVSLALGDAADKPITDLTDTLQVEVTSASETVTLPLEANFEVGVSGDPGDYRAWIIPTRSGTYALHFTGTIHGDAIDETFTSSATTFDSPKDATEAEFPAKDPTSGQLAERITQESRRTATQLTAVKANIKASNDKTSRANALAIVGIVLGALGLVIGVIGFARKR
jgi:hypothetical protein